MARLKATDPAHAEGKAKTLLDGVRKSLGGTPNLIRTLANGPAALQAYLGFGQALATGVLDAKLRESIALTAAGLNECAYCASAHTAVGRKAGLDDGELARNLAGTSNDPKVAAALAFAAAVVTKKGWVDDADLAAVRAAGYDDGGVAEIVANVAINIFTNYFNHVADTEIDFPKVDLDARQAA